MPEYKLFATPVEKQVWEVFNFLRSLGIQTEDYQVLLPLLSIYKDGIIEHDYRNYSNDLVGYLQGKVNDSNNEKSHEYRQVIASFETTLKRIRPNFLYNLFRWLFTIDQESLQSNFSQIFDSVLYQISISQGKKGAETIQPKELSQFICNLIDLPDNASVFNPFAGLASFNIFLPENILYYGQELHERTWAIGMLRLMAYGKTTTSVFKKEDSILSWPSQDKKFDLIISNPPFGVRMNQIFYQERSSFQTVEQFLIASGIESLSNSGKLVVLIPNGFLFRGSLDGHIREDLINRGLLEMVISLPAGLFHNTGIPVALLVLSKSRDVQKDVKFVDAQDYVLPSNSRNKVLDSARLLSDIKSDDTKSGKIVSVDIDSIRGNNYNLNVPRYFQNPIDGVKLKDILTFVKGSRKDLPEKGKMIRIRDLKDNKLDFNLNLSEVSEVDLTRKNTRRVSQSCLLLAVRWKSLKPTLFDYEGEDLYLNPEILSFKLNEELVYSEFLVNELHSDYVVGQLDSYRQGATIPMIRRDDLLEVVVKLPSLDEQRAKVQGITELSERIQKLEEERNALAHGKSVSQYNEFASLKHTLGRPRQNILDWADNLICYLEDNLDGLKPLNKGFKDFYETDILAALKEIKRDVNFMTYVLEKGENGLILSNYEKELISISDINKIVNELSSNGYNFRIKKQLLKGKDLQNRGVVGNRILLQTLIDNILTNAHKHGFDNKDDGNQLVIELFEVDDNLTLEFRNNGKPFPNKYDRQKFITKYSTADTEKGSGLGGYDIHRIADDFQNPDWDLLLDQDPIFPVKFKFQFPIVLKN